MSAKSRYTKSQCDLAPVMASASPARWACDFPALLVAALCALLVLLVRAPPDGSFAEYAARAQHGPGDPPPALNVTFRQLSVAFPGGRLGLRPTDGAFLAGRLVAIMGSSGSGKSTLLTALLGSGAAAVSGDVRVNGRAVPLAALSSSVGFVPQDDIMHTDLSVAANLWAAAATKLPPGAASGRVAGAVMRAVRALDLTRVADSRVGTTSDTLREHVSGGQKKRVNIGLELVADTSIVLLDEPSSGLDSASATDLVRALRALAQERSTTVAAVIHTPPAATFDLFDDLALLTTGGKLLYFGPRASGPAYFAARGWASSVAQYTNFADFCLDAAAGKLPPLEYDPALRPLPGSPVAPPWISPAEYAAALWRDECDTAYAALSARARGGSQQASGAPTNFCEPVARATLQAPVAAAAVPISGAAPTMASATLTSRAFSFSATFSHQLFPLLWRSARLLSVSATTALILVVMGTAVGLLQYVKSPMRGLPGIALRSVVGPAFSMGASMVAGTACLQLLAVEAESRMLMRETRSGLSLTALLVSKLVAGVALGLATQLVFFVAYAAAFVAARLNDAPEQRRPWPAVLAHAPSTCALLQGQVLNHAVLQAVAMLLSVAVDARNAQLGVMSFLVAVLTADQLGGRVAELSTVRHLSRILMLLEVTQYEAGCARESAWRAVTSTSAASSGEELSSFAEGGGPSHAPASTLHAPSVGAPCILGRLAIRLKADAGNPIGVVDAQAQAAALQAALLGVAAPSEGAAGAVSPEAAAMLGVAVTLRAAAQGGAASAALESSATVALRAQGLSDSELGALGDALAVFELLNDAELVTLARRLTQASPEERELLRRIVEGADLEQAACDYIPHTRRVRALRAEEQEVVAQMVAVGADPAEVVRAFQESQAVAGADLCDSTAPYAAALARLAALLHALVWTTLCGWTVASVGVVMVTAAGWFAGSWFLASSAPPPAALLPRLLELLGLPSSSATLVAEDRAEISAESQSGGADKAHGKHAVAQRATRARRDAVMGLAYCGALLAAWTIPLVWGHALQAPWREGWTGAATWLLLPAQLLHVGGLALSASRVGLSPLVAPVDSALRRPRSLHAAQELLWTVLLRLLPPPLLLAGSAAAAAQAALPGRIIDEGTAGSGSGLATWAGPAAGAYVAATALGSVLTVLISVVAHTRVLFYSGLAPRVAPTGVAASPLWRHTLVVARLAALTFTGVKLAAAYAGVVAPLLAGAAEASAVLVRSGSNDASSVGITHSAPWLERVLASGSVPAPAVVLLPCALVWAAASLSAWAGDARAALATAAAPPRRLHTLQAAAKRVSGLRTAATLIAGAGVSHGEASGALRRRVLSTI